MRVTVIGASSVSGISKSNNPFSFSSMHVLTPMETKQTEKFSVLQCAGYEPVKFDCDPKVVALMSDFPLPCEVDLTLGNVLDGRNLKSIVTGVELV